MAITAQEGLRGILDDAILDATIDALIDGASNWRNLWRVVILLNSGAIGAWFSYASERFSHHDIISYQVLCR